MASQLSDVELRKKLKEYGEDVGPVTATTRQLLEKRLDKLQEKKRESPRTLNALSSDDSDIDVTNNLDPSRVIRKRKNNSRFSGPVVHLNRINISKYLKSQPVDLDKSGFKKPIPISSRTVGTKGPTSDANNSISNFYNSKSNKRNLRGNSGNTFDFETSDSEIDSETASTPSPRPTKLRHINSYHKPSCDKENSFQVQKSHLSSSNDSSYDICSKKGINTLHQSRKFYQTPTSCYAERLPYRENSHSKGDFDKSSANGYLTDDTVLNGEFRNGKAAGKTTNYSHYISWMLVLGATAFFVIIGMVYMSEVQKVSQATATSNYVSLICEGSSRTECIPEEHLGLSLLFCRDLHDLLAATAGEYECQNEMTGRRNVTISRVTSFLKEKIQDLDANRTLDMILNYVILLIVKNPDWHIRVHLKDEKGRHSFTDPIELNNISALESVVAAKSFWCRVQHSIRWTAAELFALVLVLASVPRIFRVVGYWKQRKELQEKQMYELVEKIIGILQKPEDMHQPDSKSVPFKAVVHVRDMLIPPKERKAKQFLWNKAVAFIEENESRVRVEYQHIAGENFKIWKWLPNSTPEGDPGRQGKVWQGQAFGNLGKGKCSIPFGATRCLKIRNMFDPEVEYGDDWQVYIQDAILEKCEGNSGIVHIAVDTTSSEGCVYLMCNSSNTAGKAFNALHGWWFDGKLLTVKYLRLERYLERFPSAEHCVEPLNPSNNKRLSLSAPFFSSALERL